MVVISPEATLQETITSEGEETGVPVPKRIQPPDLEVPVPSPSTENLNSTVDEQTRAMLDRMDAINRANEMDSRSVSGSRKSGDSRSDDSRSEMPDSPLTNGHDCAQNNAMVITNGYGHQGSPGSSGLGNGTLDDDEDTDLWAVWGEIVKNWAVETKKRPQYIKELCRRGIPCHFRNIAWQLLAGSNMEAIRDTYAEYMRTPSPYEKVIKRDVYRTYPEHEFFKDGGKGQQSLFNVMKAYSLHDREVGYCQGSAFIVGLLLLQMPEEEAFAVMCRLSTEYRLREIYKPAMTELGLCMFQLECLVQEQLPDLFQHFNNMGFDTSMYASSWFLTIFTTTMKLELSNRIMDIFLSEGMEVVFRLAIAILQLCRCELLQLDMEGMLRYFQRDVPEQFESDPDLLLSTAFKVNINAKKMKRLEKDYLAKRTKEQEEVVELRRLRTECRLLRQRVEYLEQESEALADRLIRGQVNLAQEAENKMSITHEFHKLREINYDTNKKLEDAYEAIRDLSSKHSDGKVEIGIQIDDTSMVEHIHSLQEQLMQSHVREADHDNCIRDLKLRVQELEIANKRLKETPPDHSVATIQEELISVKMREAEASLSLKEMRQRLAELEQQWTEYTQGRAGAEQAPVSASGAGQEPAANKPPSPSLQPDRPPIPGDDDEQPPSETSATAAASQQQQQQKQHSLDENQVGRKFSLMEAISRKAQGFSSFSASMPSHSDQPQRPPPPTVKELEDQLMGVRIRETDTFAELKEMRQKVMELETQNHVCTNQLRRQDEEHKKLKHQLEELEEREKELQKKLREEQRKTMDADSLLKESQVTARLQQSEMAQTVAELKEKIAEYESKRAEKWTKMQLRGESCDNDDNASSGTPVSLTTSHDRLSMTSETSADNFNLAEMAVNVPPELLDVEKLSNGLRPGANDQDSTSDTDTPDKAGGV